MAKKSSHLWLKIVVGIVIVLVLLAGAAELGVRWMVSKQLKDDFAQQAGAVTAEEPTISFGSYPVLLGALQKDIHHVDLTTPNTLQITYPGGPDSVPEVTGMPKAHITIDGLKLDDPNRPIASTLNVDTTVSDEFILAQAQRAMDESTSGSENTQPQSLEDLAGMLLKKVVKITDVTSNPAEGTLGIEFTGGAANLAVKPVVSDGEVSFEAAGASLFGIDMPQEVIDALTNGLKDSAGGMAGSMQVTNFRVVDGGLDVSMVGHDVDLQNMK
ncbi:LmeA family phospholipid-binding protein [Corynebacterium aquilae]|uniref:DUF2993 domain-containing protein n=1 Tax=Corynebacterium aquilae DSM 44791 TaxID=1431546 RepID=A0A1L7CDJ5_9CORY|nr:DUF2993 domain-containing protein [Corynebacterium aquilae]APT83906.1 hypothetical protein CAQU_01120 [Corynebacterium aquilae DSM 44791]